jgi:hypothetical protein
VQLLRLAQLQLQAVHRLLPLPLPLPLPPRVQLLRLAQLQLQVMQYKLQEAKAEQDALEEGALSLRARLAAMPTLHLGGWALSVCLAAMPPAA